MSDGHRTTSIQRPRGTRGARLETLLDRRPDAQREPRPDKPRFAEFTRPIPKDRQLVKGRVKRLLFALVALVIVAALAASLFVLPVKSWRQQRSDLSRKQSELAVLRNANAQLAADVNRLQTPDGIREAARQDVGLVSVGEERISVLSTPNAPVTLPAGWPYDAITQIIAVRAIPPAAAPAAP